MWIPQANHNSVDFSQRTAPQELDDDDAVRAAEIMEKLTPHSPTWHDPVLRKRWLDEYRDAKAGYNTSELEDSRLRQETPEEERQLTRQFADDFWSGDNAEQWRKSHFAKL